MELSMKGLPSRLGCVDDSISANVCSTASWSWEYDQMMLAFVTTSLTTFLVVRAVHDSLEADEYWSLLQDGGKEFEQWDTALTGD